MDENLEDKSKYYDKFVATDGFNGKKVIAYGDDHDEVRTRAKKLSEHPIMSYYPDPDKTCVPSMFKK
jgi:hypothetical protein